METKIDEIIRTERRTIFLEITPDARLVVHAPMKSPKRVIQEAVEQKRDWVRKKQGEARSRDGRHPPKRCAEGETFELFGETFILVFEDAAEISADRGRLVVPEKYRDDARSAIAAWYKEQAGSYPKTDTLARLRENALSRYR
jgi:predicted metal-dependent hydrolase